MQDIMDEVWGDSLTHENTVQAAISKIRGDLKRFGIEDLVIDGKTNPGHYKLYHHTHT
jgi:DNA-binding winged helix-turn-helix (wHTH) protein